MLKVAIFISGRGSNMEALINACEAPNFPAQIELVISNNPNAKGLDIAQNAGIKTVVIDNKKFKTKREFENAIQEKLEKNDIEFICLAGFMRIISSEFVGLWSGKMINIHPSLLPKFKGLDTHKRAIEAGEKYAGATVHFVTPEMDSGPIIIQAVVPVYKDDTEDILAARVLKEEYKIYSEALKLVASGKTKIEDNIVRILNCEL